MAKPSGTERWRRHTISTMSRGSLRRLAIVVSRPPGRGSRYERSLRWFGIACITALTDSPIDQVQRDYEAGPDPWGYARRPEEAERYAAALDMLNQAAAAHSSRAVDVGCGEGFFTETLARRYTSVLALDIVSVALERAKERCAGMTNVEFREWDLRSASPPGEFDVVVAMEVIEYLARPRERRAAVAKLARMVSPGGQLLVTATLEDPVVERSRWGRWMLWGGRHVVDRFARTDPNLVHLRMQATPDHVVALYERRGR